MSIHVMVAEQEPMMRECMVCILKGQHDLTVVGEAADGRKALSMACELKPEVALVDIDLPLLNGMETARRMHEQSVQSIIVCTTHDTPPPALDTGQPSAASAYLGRQSSTDDFLTAIRDAVKQRPSTRGWREVESNWQRISDTQRDGRPFTTLTPREREVLQLLAEGYVTKEVSAILEMSVKTVSTHRVHIKEKLGTKSVALLTKYAIREGLTHI